jgi:prepilin-type N-terminal cleavage/methylation domain-containing protein
MKRLQQLKSNKGFSLVELLIVIAIMAVLVGILAPQYIRYVERSRQSADIQVVNSIASTMKTVLLDPMNGEAAAGITQLTITWNGHTAGDGQVTVAALPGTIAQADVDILRDDLAGIVGLPVSARSNLASRFATVIVIAVDGDGAGRVTSAGHTDASDDGLRGSWSHALRNIIDN